MPQPNDLPPHNPQNKRKKYEDEALLTIHLMNGTIRQFAFYENSPFRSWHLSPQVISPKDTLTIKYANGERIHFPLCNVESYHVSPRRVSLGWLEGHVKREVKPDAETSPAVHD